MSAISAQVSVYGLGGADTAVAVTAFLQALQNHKVGYEMGSMSTVLWGDDVAVWNALREGYTTASALGPVVMQVTVSNACPLSQTKGDIHGRSV